MSKYKFGEKYICECGRDFDKSQSLNAHFSRCLVHRNGEPPKKRNHGGGWSKGLTKETSESVAKYSNTLSKLPGRKWTDEQKSAHSRIMKGKSGGVREGSNRWKGINIEHKYETVWLDSSYEMRLVLVLNKFGIDWDKNYKKFPYYHKGEKRNYIPDFYISELDIWIETKGWMKEIDISKWSQFPNKLKVLFKKELNDIENIESRSEFINYIMALCWKW